MADNEVTKISEIDEDEFAAQAAANVGFTKAESIIPFVRILQPLSPQLHYSWRASRNDYERGEWFVVGWQNLVSISFLSCRCGIIPSG